jgi:hypothetical protein
MIDRFPSSQHRSESNEETPHELTLRETADFFFWSFYYSQGDPAHQNKLIRAAASLHPKVHLPQLSSKDIWESDKERYLQYLQQGKVHVVKHEELIRSTIDDEWEKALNAFNTLAVERVFTKNDWMMLTIQCIKQDADALGEGWRLLSDKRPTTGYFRKNMSHFVTFVLEGKEGPGPKYFSEVMRHIREQLLDPEFVQGVTRACKGELQKLLRVQPAALDEFPELRRLTNQEI